MVDLTSEISFGLMLMTGFLGSAGHCVGMCGGYVLTCSVKASETSGRLGNLVRQSAYHVGRIWCYALMGAISGLAGEAVFGSSDTMTGRTVVWLAAGALMIAFGVQRLGLIRSRPSSGFGINWYSNVLAAVGGGNAIGHYLLFGFLNGLVPCGLSYSVLPAAAASGSPLMGAGLMFAFGLGTIPALGALAATSSLMASTTRGHLLKIAALLVIGLGCLSVARGVEAIASSGASATPACACCSGQ